MGKFAATAQYVISAMQQNFKMALSFIILLWIITIFNRVINYRLNVLGIWPRTIHGLFGIPFYSFLHGNFEHLFFNSIPLFFLVDLVLLDGLTKFYLVTMLIIIVSGIGIWLIGKRGIHIGASSLLMGYFGYLLAKAYFQFNATTIILAIICLYYFGGLILALFPSVQKNISWEGHLCGFLAGVGIVYYNQLL